MDTIVDLHTHSVLSRHAYSSVTENIEYAYSKGLKVYGISEHQYDDFNVGAHHFVFLNGPRAIPNYWHEMRVLKGAELNILDGHFDVDKIKPQILDYCIASMHTYVYSKDHTAKENTDNYIMAINTPYINIIGHMDSSNYPCDYEAVIKEASNKNVLIELNNASLNPNGSRKNAKEIDIEILKYCVKYNCPIIINSDAHIKYDIGNFDRANSLLEEISFPKELIVNNDLELLNKYIPLYVFKDVAE